MSAAPIIGFQSLGCAKALVDSERILTQLRAEGYEFTETYDGANIVIVNTCGFLDTARDESLAAIGEAMAENGKVIVTGCLGAEPDVIRAKFPNVLSITGPAQYESVVKAVHEALPPKHDPYLDLLPKGGIKLTPRHYAYLKISEGSICYFEFKTSEPIHFKWRYFLRCGWRTPLRVWRLKNGMGRWIGHLFDRQKFQPIS